MSGPTYGPGTVIVVDMDELVCVLLTNSFRYEVSGVYDAQVFGCEANRVYRTYFHEDEVLIAVDPTQDG